MPTTILNVKVPKVFNLESPRTSKPVANQFVIDTPEGQYFQSYDSMIAVRRYNHGEAPSVVLDIKYWDYSVTTLKYLKQFLGVTYTKSEIQQLINKSVFATANLNKDN